MADAIRFLALLSILVEKGIVTRQEAGEIRDVGSAVELLVSKGIVTEAEAIERMGDLREVLAEARSLLLERAPSEHIRARLVRIRSLFPKLVDYLQEEIQKRDSGPRTN